MFEQKKSVPDALLMAKLNELPLESECFDVIHPAELKEVENL